MYDLFKTQREQVKANDKEERTLVYQRLAQARQENNDLLVALQAKRVHEREMEDELRTLKDVKELLTKYAREGKQSKIAPEFAGICEEYGVDPEKVAEALIADNMTSMNEHTIRLYLSEVYDEKKGVAK